MFTFSSRKFHVKWALAKFSRLVLHYTLFTWITSCTWTFYQLNYSISYWINIAHAQSPLKRSLILRKEMTSRKTVWLSNFRWRDDLSTGIRHSSALISVRSLSLYLFDLKLHKKKKLIILCCTTIPKSTVKKSVKLYKITWQKESYRGYHKNCQMFYKNYRELKYF